MILFIFEGKKREPQLFKTLEYLFFSNRNEEAIVYSFGNNVYELYTQMLGLDGAGSIVSILREKSKNEKNNPLSNFSNTSDFSEIYLFFDYDFQNSNFSLPEMNERLEKMLDFFDNETDNGKLYINYPMIESIRCTEKLPDSDYWQYTVTREVCHHFKHYVTQQYQHYKSFDFITFQLDGKSQKVNVPTAEKFNEIERNWQHLKKQNVSKANYICNGDLSHLPEKRSITQQKIFIAQLEKYVNTECCNVAILNAFPIFLYDYFK